MNRKMVIGIVALATFALLGLMLIQIYWIRNAMLIEEQSFERRAREAVSNVIHQLELKETAMDFSNSIRIASDRPGDENNAFEDSLSGLFTDTVTGRGKLEFNYTETQSGKIIRQIDTSILDDGSGIHLDFDVHHNDSGAADYQRKQPTTTGRSGDRVRNFMEQRVDLMNEVLGNMLSGNVSRSISERINPGLLDTMLNIEFNRFEINTPYEFGVFNMKKNDFIFQKTGEYHRELLEEGMAFTLFPADFSANPDFLFIYFPREKRFILFHISSFLLISLILVLIIILSFTYTVFTIFKQKRLSLLKNDFINNMTHEFKTPISTVALACEALNDEDIIKSPTLYSNYIGIISEENKRLGGMAEKILQQALIEKDQISLNKELCDIHQLINEVVKNIKIQIEIKDGSITTNFRAGQFLVYVDRMHLINVFNNLLDNANKYSPRKPEIIISTENNSGNFIAHIKDNGIGINNANQMKIFSKLYRVPTGNIHNYKGFGLGLSYVKAIVEAHKGKVTLDSEPEKGSVFHVYLPMETINT